MKLYHKIILIFLASWPLLGVAQINTDQVLRIGQNALYFEDYVLSIQYFNQVIAAKPYLAQPYFYRSLAKFNLDDYAGAETDVTTAIEHNPFITDAYELRGVIRQNMGKTKLAIADYDKALEMLPENRGILFNKALALDELKDYDAAKNVFDLLISKHPRFDSGYLGRAKLYLSLKDTVAAISDIDKALSINKNAVNAYVMRADIAINSHKDYEKALADMNEAIRLQPKYSGYFINRAFLRHQTDDYYGAMSDYDYAVQLDPLNSVALYNRALLRAEVHDYNRAIDDLNQVLALNPNDYRTLYNRSIVLKEKGDYNDALKDVNKVIDAYPDLAAAYFLRFDIKRLMGDRSAEKDYNRSLALAKKRIKKTALTEASGISANAASESMDNVFGSISANSTDDESEPQEVVAARFSSLLTITDNANVEQEYNNKSIRGKVQNHTMTIDIEPMFVVAYYTSPTELKPTSDYMREVDDVNKVNALRFLLQVTNKEASLSEADDINRHFESINYYNSYISTHTPRAIDYFGRGMDQITVRNFKAAEEDFSKSVELLPDFTLGYFMRAVARYKEFNAERDAQNTDTQLRVQKAKATYTSILCDFDQVLKLSPGSSIAYYNKGVIYMDMQDYTSALSAFNKAIELKPDFGEAYYNRGYVYFKLGNKNLGTANLSKAGELGIVPSYSLLKRMSN